MDRSGAIPALLTWLTVAVLWMTWSPLALRDQPAFPSLGISGKPLETLLNLLLLVPMSLCVGARFPWSRRVGFLWIILAFGVGALIIETGQVWIVGRTPSAADWALNVLGAMLGVQFGHGLVRRGTPVGRVVLAASGVMAIAVGGVMLVSAVTLTHRIALRHWDPEYQVLSGDEVGGDRAFLGEVTDGLICSGPEEEPTCISPGAERVPRVRLVNLALDSQRFWIRAKVLSRGAQSGPARIVTFSENPGARNVTLAQDGDALILRVRSELHGPNGALFAYRMPNAVPDSTPIQVSAEYRGGEVGIIAEGPDRIRSVHFKWSFLTAWLSWHSGPYLTASLLATSAVIGALVFFLPFGFVSCVLQKRRRAWSIVIAPGMALTVMVAASLISGLDFVVRDMVLACSSGVLGAVACMARAC